jgi:hypothetical protein
MEILTIRTRGMRPPKAKYVQAIPLYMKSDKAVFEYFRDHKDEIDATTGSALMIPLPVEVETGNATAVASIFSPGVKDSRYPGLLRSDLPCFWLEDSAGGAEIIRLPDKLSEVSAYLRAMTDAAAKLRDAKSIKADMDLRLNLIARERAPWLRFLMQELNMSKSTEKLIAVISGVVFVAAILAMAMIYPNPTPFQYEVFRIVLSGALAGFVSMTPGFLEVTFSNFARGGSALGVFLVVYFFNPASLVATAPV